MTQVKKTIIAESLKKLKVALESIVNSTDAVDQTNTADPLEYALSDGSPVYIDKLEAGGIVTTKDTTGAFTPVAAGTVTLADGTTITVGENGVISEIVAPEITQEMRAQQLQQHIQKFAAGTPEERIANLEMVCKVLMEYCFGWDIRRAQEEAAKTQAISIYQTFREEEKAKKDEVIEGLKTSLKATNQKMIEMASLMQDILLHTEEKPDHVPANKIKDGLSTQSRLEKFRESCKQ